MSDNMKNWIFAVLMAVCGYLYTQLSAISVELHSTTQLSNTQARLARIHIKDMENRIRILEHANCSSIDPSRIE